MRRLGFICVLVALIAAPGESWGQSVAEDFAQSCAMCHTIGGGPLAGPDLAGMSERRERSWLIRFIVDAQAVIESGDPDAQQMVDQYQGMVMPTMPGMTPDRAAALTDYVAERSGSQAPGIEEPPAAKEPFTSAEVQEGLRLFRGDQAFEAGGAACLACHQAADLGGLGGGSLGPPLSDVFSRLGGRQGLPSWLSSPPTPTMNALYRTRPLSEQEIKALTAFFEDRASDAPGAASSARSQFLLLGAGGTIVLLFLFHLTWRSRFRGVRRRLVETYRIRGAQ